MDNTSDNCKKTYTGTNKQVSGKVQIHTYNKKDILVTILYNSFLPQIAKIYYLLSQGFC